jgi:hypothetical protein
VLIVALVRDEAPATCNIKKAIEQEDMLVDGAALIASNYLLSYPNIHHRIGDILQHVPSQLCSHMFVVDTPVVLGLFFGYCDVWYVVVIEKHIQCEYLTYATIGITTRLTLPNKRHHWHLHIIY